jgi:hypothetical protein
MLGIVTNGKTQIQIRLALGWDPERRAYVGPLMSESEKQTPHNHDDQSGIPLIVVTPVAFLKAISIMVADGQDITEALDPEFWLNFLGHDGVSRDIEPLTDNREGDIDRTQEEQEFRAGR